MIIPIPVGAIRRMAQQAQLETEARRRMAAEAGYACAFCGEVDMPEVVRGGEVWIHAMGYLAWIVPGILYGMWRNRHRKLKCRKCRRIVGDAPPA
jgi:hypothetical protein